MTKDNGILAWGRSIEPEMLVLAYSRGIFPWPIEEGEPIPWVCPPRRGVLDFKNLHVPKSLARLAKRAPFRLSINEAFDQVIEACAEARKGKTWITSDMLRAYKHLHKMGHGHSAEAWDGSTLVGGIYGVWIAGYFSAESMYYIKSGASKLALLHLIDYLKKGGLTWMDIQQLTPHMREMGAKAITRAAFLKRIGIET